MINKEREEVYCKNCTHHSDNIPGTKASDYCDVKKSLITGNPVECHEVRGNIRLCGAIGRKFNAKETQEEFIERIKIEANKRKEKKL